MVRDRTGSLGLLKQAETFKYVVAVMNAKGACEHGLENRIKAALAEVERLT